jgi:hypothetical protein
MATSLTEIGFDLAHGLCAKLAQVLAGTKVWCLKDRKGNSL